MERDLRAGVAGDGDGLLLRISLGAHRRPGGEPVFVAGSRRAKPDHHHAGAVGAVELQAAVVEIAGGLRLGPSRQRNAHPRQPDGPERLRRVQRRAEEEHSSSDFMGGLCRREAPETRQSTVGFRQSVVSRRQILRREILRDLNVVVAARGQERSSKSSQRENGDQKPTIHHAPRTEQRAYQRVTRRDSVARTRRAMTRLSFFVGDHGGYILMGVTAPAAMVTWRVSARPRARFLNITWYSPGGSSRRPAG